MQLARHGVYIQLASPLNCLPARNRAVEAMAVDAVHALAKAAMIGVAAGPDITGLRASSGLFVSVVHVIYLPFTFILYHKYVTKQ